VFVEFESTICHQDKQTRREVVEFLNSPVGGKAVPTDGKPAGASALSENQCSRAVGLQLLAGTLFDGFSKSTSGYELIG
jgi:hypothetical protein